MLADHLGRHVLLLCLVFLAGCVVTAKIVGGLLNTLEPVSPITGAPGPDDPRFFFTVGRNLEGRHLLVALADYSGAIIEQRVREANDENRVLEAVQEEWPLCKILWDTEEPSGYGFYLPQESIGRIESELNEQFRRQIPDDIALAKRGFEIRILSDDSAARTQTVQLTIHRGNIPDVFVYEVRPDGVIARAYRPQISYRLPVTVFGVFVGFMASALVHVILLKRFQG